MRAESDILASRRPSWKAGVDPNACRALTVLDGVRRTLIVPGRVEVEMFRSAGRLMRWFAVAVVTISVTSPVALADLRIQNKRFSTICRVVAFVDDHRGSRVVHDGPVRKGAHRTFKNAGATLCIQRSVVPERCNSGLTRPVCKVDRHSNRTVLWTIQ